MDPESDKMEIFKGMAKESSTFIGEILLPIVTEVKPYIMNMAVTGLPLGLRIIGDLFWAIPNIHPYDLYVEEIY